MSDLHDLCRFTTSISPDHVIKLREFLSQGIPSTYTVEEAYNYVNNIDKDPETTTTPLHLICTHYPKDCSGEQLQIVKEMVQILFEYGAGWCLVDVNGDTPGCILSKRGIKGVVYDEIVDAGVRAELLLRKVDNNIEFLEPELDSKELETPGESGIKQIITDDKLNVGQEPNPAATPSDYLADKLTYRDNVLVTSNNDGVMMSWESSLMQKGCDALFSTPEAEMTVLNIGFGMGIIDTMIQSKNPIKHFIIEPHSDVLAQMKTNGWYDKPNVVILEGTWQQQLPHLLDSGIFFNGIYYDTFSEHYEDMLELFDYIVGLLKMNGTFSFFNGLGADREIVYEVYKKLVEIDLSEYGLEVSFENINVDELDWQGIKQSYWNCPVYYHPIVKFKQ